MRTLRSSRWSWLLSLAVALFAAVGGLAGNLLADEIHPKLAGYRWFPWMIFAIFAVAALIGALRDIRGKTSMEPKTSKQFSSSITIGGDANGINIAGDGNVVVHRDIKE